MNRGDVYLADLGDPVGHEQSLRRPVVIVSAQPWLASNPPVVAAVPVTRTHREWVHHVEIELGQSGLRVTSYAACENVRAMSSLRLGRRFGQVEAATMAQIDQTLSRLLGL